MDSSLIQNWKKPLDVQMLHELFEYRDGKLFRRVGVAGNPAGSEAGCVTHKGYREVGVNYAKYGVHHLIWVMHGKPPVKMLDHIDGDPLNNRIENLRAVDSSRNQMNAKLRKDSTSGVKGVSWNKKYKRWIGQVWYKRRIYGAGSFKDKQECIDAVAKLRSELHGEFANHTVAC